LKEVMVPDSMTTPAPLGVEWILEANRHAL